MKILLKTKVKANYREILPQLSKRELFQLACRMMGASLKRYEGHAIEDEYHIEFNFPFLSRQEWVGLITDYGEDEQQVYFVDEGKQLPFFLKLWRHKHAFVKIDEDHAQIVDDIDFSTSSLVGDVCLYPFIFSHFLCRKMTYRFFVEKDAPWSAALEALMAFAPGVAKGATKGGAR